MIGAVAVLVLLHLAVSGGVWLTSPWPWLAMVTSVIGLLGLLVAVRWQLTDLSRMQGCVVIICWQAPGLVTGTWALAMFFSFMPLMDAPVFILQGWLHLWSPWWAGIPGGFYREVGWYLWAIAVLPLMLTAVAVSLVSYWHPLHAGHNPRHGLRAHD